MTFARAQVQVRRLQNLESRPGALKGTGSPPPLPWDLSALEWGSFLHRHENQAAHPRAVENYGPKSPPSLHPCSMGWGLLGLVPQPGGEGPGVLSRVRRPCQDHPMWLVEGKVTRETLLSVQQKYLSPKHTSYLTL